MSYTEQQLREAAQRALEAGDVAAAEELAQAAMALRQPPQRERLRAIGQGLTLGFGDEIMAGVRALSPNQTYDAALEDERSRLSDYRENFPASSAAYEVGGAVLPAIGAGTFTGGTGTGAVMGATAARAAPTMARTLPALARNLLARVGTAPTLARTAVAGAGTGGVYGFGTGEGGVGPRLGNAAIDATIGAIGGVGGQAAGTALARPLEAITDFARRRIGGRAGNVVQAEIQRLAAESGMSVDEVIDRVANGQMMAEVSETLRFAARAYKSSTGEGSAIISEAFRRRNPDGTTYTRAGEMGAQALDRLTGALAPDFQPNILRDFAGRQAAARAAERGAYRQAFEGAGDLTPEIIDEMGAVLQRAPAAARDAAELIRARTGQNPYFTVSEAGEVRFGRAPTLEEAELVRRALNDAASRAFRGGQGALGEALDEMEGGLRSQIDDFAPQLSDVRATAAGTRAARDAFNSGRTALTRPADQVMMEFDQVMAQGEEAVAAYRAGLMDNLRRIAQSPSGPSLMGRLADPQRGTSTIINSVLDEADRAEVMAMVGRAADSQAAQNTIMGGSQTAQTLAQSGRIGSAGLMADVGQALRGDVLAAGRAAMALAGEAMQGMNERQRAEVARLLVERNPDVLRRALTDESGLMALQRQVELLGAVVRRGGAATGTVAAPPAINERPAPQMPIMP